MQPDRQCDTCQARRDYVRVTTVGRSDPKGLLTFSQFTQFPPHRGFEPCPPYPELGALTKCQTTLLQGLTLISSTQTGCRRLDSYIEQKKFLACGPEFSVEFSAPPEFSGGVTEKYLSTGWARTFDLQIRKQIFYHCATAPLCTISCLSSLDFPAVSVVTGSRIFRPYLVVTCRDFPAVSAVTGSRIFRPYL
jgi:hypothetical protein